MANDNPVISHKSRQAGVSLYIALMIMTMLLGIGFGMSALLLSQLDTLRGIGYSVLAFYATEAGVDRVLYIDQKTCASIPDRLFCLWREVPAGDQFLSNGAIYTMVVEPPGAGVCPETVTYCAKSVGTYQQARRAVRVAR